MEVKGSTGTKRLPRAGSRRSVEGGEIETMLTVAITGGIAMGKSTVARQLRAHAGSAAFDADACVASLLTGGEVCEMIGEEFGREMLNPDGSVNRPALRERVFDSVERRAVLEGIVHPVVRQRYRADWEHSREAGVSVFFAEIPLFYETRSEYPVDWVLVVAAPREVQMRRLLERPGIGAEIAEQMVAAQLPIETKLQKADAVIWNSGSREALIQQTQFFRQWLNQKTLPNST